MIEKYLSTRLFDDRGLPYHHGTSGCVFSILRMATEADICLWICGCVRCVLSCLLLSGVFLIRNLAGTALVCAGSSVPYGGVSSDRKDPGKNCETSSKTDPVETVILSGEWCLPVCFLCLVREMPDLDRSMPFFLFLYKTGCALCLLYQAFRAYRNEVCKTPVLLVGTVLFGASLVADRMYPGYEPIYGGWFQEIGLFMLVLSIGYELAKDLAGTYRASLILRQETHYLATQIEMQKTHYRELNDRIDEMVRMRHDHRHHMQTLASYLQQQDISLAKEYLQKYMGAEEQKGRIILCRNMLADALLKYYQSLCGRHKIRFECAADLPEEIEMEDTDFTILFGNLLEKCLGGSQKTERGWLYKGADPGSGKPDHSLH